MSISKRDYYEVLGVSKSADEAELKKAYRRMAMEFHPDRRPGDREAEEKFKEAAEAYSVLSDSEKRQLYDRFGHQGPAQSGFSGFGGVEDIFSAFADIFGGFGGFGGGRRVARGNDLEITVEIPFMDAAKGCKRDLDVERNSPCDECKGSGAKPGTQPQRCRTCQGRGQVAHQQGFFVISTTCRQCGGQGSIITEKCSACSGTAHIPKKGVVSVTIPAGIDDGQKLRLSYQGDPAPASGGEPGDLYVHIRVQQDPRFVRDGDNLWVDTPLTFAEAALGTRISVPTPDGAEMIDVAPGTQPMMRQVLARRGLPNVRGRGRGDLIVRFLVQVPTELTPEVREIIEKLAPHLGSPREEAAREAEHDDDADKGSVFERILGGRGRKKK